MYILNFRVAGFLELFKFVGVIYFPNFVGLYTINTKFTLLDMQ